ncbi:MAG TPA: hypothetical protein PKA99_02700 [Dermatophilaceae bacterium]|nr:hypothetical protein [Dermatophilaceae bacterium]
MTDRGVLLLRADADRAVAWARRGLVAVHVVPQEGGWVAVCPLGERSEASAPYDRALTALLARPVPRRLCPALGVAVVGERLVLNVVAPAIRPRRLWLAWEPGVGLVRPGSLPITTVATLAAAVGKPLATDLAARVLRDGRGAADQVLTDLLRALDVPGAEFVTGDRHAGTQPHAVAVIPERQDVSRFERRTREDHRWHEESQR